MRLRKAYGFLAAILLLAVPGPALALLDQFAGDAAIYSGSTEYLRPTVLFVIDNSAGMRQSGSREPYDPAVDYTYAGAAYSKDVVYERKTQTGGTINYVAYIADVNTGVSCTEAQDLLNTTGFYAGPLRKNTGACSGTTGNYFLGNLLNYLDAPATIATWSPDTAYQVGDKVAPTTPVVDANGTPLTFEVAATADADADGTTLSGSSEPTWPTTVGATVTDGELTWTATGSILDMLQVTLKQVIAGARNSVKFGMMVFGDNNHGAKVVEPVRRLGVDDPDDPDTTEVDDGVTNFAELTTAIDNITLLNANAQPIEEALFDAGYYLSGNNDDTRKVSSDNTSYPSPITLSCGKTFVIVLTTGAANPSISPNVTQDVGDQDNDGQSGYADDVAKALYEGDYNTSLAGDQRIQTNIIQLITPYVPILEEATNASHGRGEYFHVTNSNELTEALLKSMSNIVNESDTSFVAPVVPTSPENRTYSGERVYLGFFKPISQRPWHGNLKKYGLDINNQVIDKNGDPATLADGSFSASATSFWSTTPDAGDVEEGGAGEKLLVRNFATNPRKIYTNRGSSDDLTASSNAFNTTNIAPADLGVADAAARDALVAYVHGLDSYDDDGDAVLTEKREWILGDILHSKPQIINYNHYTFNTTNEADPNVNKTVIFVGGNDGMLHAFRDADGEELWAFIPDEVLPNLGEMAKRPATHTYFVDASPIAYIHDHDHDGNIGPSENADGDSDLGANDKVVLLFGLRRGGEAYYALDVTDPTSPELLWKITPATTGFKWLGETWSDPQLAKVKIGTDEKIVAFVGAGYDRFEDARYGNVYGVNAADLTPNKGMGNVVTAATNWIDLLPLNNDSTNTDKHWVGKGIYAIEVATLSSGVPSLTTSGSQVWKYTSGTQTNSYRLWYAIPSDVTVADTDYDGFSDRLYVGDLGGRMWRFDVGNSSTANWTGRIIFYENTGQKIFYRPSITYEAGYTNVFFGTGDREHPLNTHAVNRFVGLKDKGQQYPAAVVTGATAKLINLTNLRNQTDNELQAANTTVTRQGEILDELNADANYGFYIHLNQRPGEKVLASPLAFNKVAYFTTYTPNPTFNPDPCNPGNLGISRLYAVDYKTGEAVLNFNAANDSTSVSNERSLSDAGDVLLRADREVTLGVGIPSGLVVVMPPSGDAKLLIGCGGGLCAEDPKIGGTIIPIYWMQW